MSKAKEIIETTKLTEEEIKGYEKELEKLRDDKKYHERKMTEAITTIKLIERLFETFR
jgi:hypothetical protein